ncbi:Diaminohydroxyphosphoribosylaminopyrimidine deaminase / 5-amino-6-(5-phosphoribosylamino)uracil reductase [Lachnospiraceae bacterium TWA4]|nr:Diaminohydroxyphosphoribosylaminopyrimidine deaminase / 5-amino-6-(5-phosphoribosylamino)uracil reductase [Lachnospiraceae bacterium TWA4]
MEWNSKDREYMSLALSLAKKGMGFTNPNPMVGAVIVKDGEIIGKGYHECCGKGHAEVNAFHSVTEDPKGATLYVTLEPCSHYGKTPPCADLVIERKVSRVVVAMKDPNELVAGRGIDKIREAGIRVDVGLMEEEAKKLNEVFIKYIVEKEPFVVLKTAMTLDGKIATATGQSQWISCEESRKQVHELRKKYMGILVGVQTVLDDNPSLTAEFQMEKILYELFVIANFVFQETVSY